MRQVRKYTFQATRGDKELAEMKVTKSNLTKLVSELADDLDPGEKAIVAIAFAGTEEVQTSVRSSS
jgi:hypothetical protein